VGPELKVLESFLVSRKPLLATEVASLTGLPRSSVFRVLKTLRTAGFLFQNAEARHYVLGPKALQLGALAQEQLAHDDLVAPPLLELRQITGETVTFSIVDLPNRLCTFVLDGPSDLRAVAQAGARYPLHLGAAGKVILAHLPEDVTLSMTRAQGLNSLQMEELGGQLAAIRDAGFATTRGERVSGTTAIAAPVFLAGKVVGSVAVAGPHERMSDVIDRQRGVVMAAARSLEHRLTGATDTTGRSDAEPA
jgi:DNA-binding IclR family transcriptional regulator